MSKLQQICPSCFSTRIRVRIGGGGYTENGIYRIPDDFGEIYECPDCSFQGAGVLDGNPKLVDFLVSKRAGLRKARQAFTVQEAKSQSPMKPLMLVDVQAKLL